MQAKVNKIKPRISVYPSFYLLKQIISRYPHFKNKTVCFPTVDIQIKESSDIVFFSDAPKQILRLLELPENKKIRLWVLDEQVKKNLLHFYSFNSKYLAVIPRPQVIFKHKATSPKMLFSENFNFIIASRSYKNKNIDKAVQFISLICKLTKKKHILHICGPRFSNSDFKRIKIKKDDKKFVKFYGDLKSNWPGKFKKLSNCIYINFSTDNLEDFSVSCYQAQLANWPLITFDIGVFKKIINYPHFRVTLLFPKLSLSKKEKYLSDFLNSNSWPQRNKKKNTAVKTPRYLKVSTARKLIIKKLNDSFSLF